MENLCKTNKQFYDSFAIIILYTIFIMVINGCDRSSDAKSKITDRTEISIKPKATQRNTTKNINKKSIKKELRPPNFPVFSISIIEMPKDRPNILSKRVEFVGVDQKDSAIIVKYPYGLNKSKYYSCKNNFSLCKFLFIFEDDSSFSSFAGQNIFVVDNKLFELRHKKLLFYRDYNYKAHRKKKKVKWDPNDKYPYDARWDRILPLKDNTFAHIASIFSIAFSEDKKRVVTAVCDTLEMDLKVWDTKTRKLICSYRNANNYKYIKTMPNGLIVKDERVFAYDVFGKVNIINLKNCKNRGEINFKELPSGYYPCFYKYNDLFFVCKKEKIMKIKGDKLFPWYITKSPGIDLGSVGDKMILLRNDNVVEILKIVKGAPKLKKRFYFIGRKLKYARIFLDSILLVQENNSIYLLQPSNNKLVEIKKTEGKVFKVKLSTISQTSLNSSRGKK